MKRYATELSKDQSKTSNKVEFLDSNDIEK